MKIYTLETSEGWGENHHVGAVFLTQEARSNYLKDSSHVVTEPPDAEDNQWWGWHDQLSHSDVSADSQEAVIAAVLKEIAEEYYDNEYDVIE